MIRICCILATTLLFTPLAAAQSDVHTEVLAYPQTTTVAAPLPGSSVGRTVTFSGSAKPRTALTVRIDGKTYVDVRDRSTADARGAAASGVADASGTFSFRIDLSGDRVVRGGDGTFEALESGQHTFIVHELYAPAPGRSAVIPLVVGDERSGASTEGENTNDIEAPADTYEPVTKASQAVPVSPLALVALLGTAGLLCLGLLVRKR